MATSLVAAAAGASLVAAWAVQAGTIPTWPDLGISSDEVASLTTEGRRYPLRLTLPDARPIEAAVRADPVLPKSPSVALVDEIPAEMPDLASAHSEQVAPHPETKARPSRLTVATFDIRDFGSTSAVDGAGSLVTSKPVILGGDRIGSIELTVGRGASVSVDRKDLSALVADRAPGLSAALSRETTDRVTFDALRTREVAIRYDPLADAVVIEPQS